MQTNVQNLKHPVHICYGNIDSRNVLIYISESKLVSLPHPRYFMTYVSSYSGTSAKINKMNLLITLNQRTINKQISKIQTSETVYLRSNTTNPLLTNVISQFIHSHLKLNSKILIKNSILIRNMPLRHHIF